MEATYVDFRRNYLDTFITLVQCPFGGRGRSESVGFSSDHLRGYICSKDLYLYETYWFWTARGRYPPCTTPRSFLTPGQHTPRLDTDTTSHSTLTTQNPTRCDVNFTFPTGYGCLPWSKRLHISRKPLIWKTSHSTRHFLGPWAIHPPSVKSSGWTVVEIIDGQAGRRQTEIPSFIVR